VRHEILALYPDRLTRLRPNHPTGRRVLQVREAPC
jgi:hypothetical protein